MTPIQTYPRLRARLRDTHGFMLAEQLVSIIFIGLLSVAVAAGLTAALTAYSNITRQTNADNLLARAVESVSDELAYATDIEFDAGGNAVFVSGTYHERVALNSDGAGVWLMRSGDSIKLVPAANGLVPKVENVTYSDGEDETVGKKDRDTWTFRVQIWSGTNVLAKTDMQVKRIGS